MTGISDGERAEMMARLYLNIGIVAEAAGEPDRARTAYDKVRQSRTAGTWHRAVHRPPSSIMVFVLPSKGTLRRFQTYEFISSDNRANSYDVMMSNVL